jgi:hypothetical protein
MNQLGFPECKSNGTIYRDTERMGVGGRGI